jgi:hypothetical protein
MRGKCVSGRTVRLLTLLIVAVCGSASAAAAQTTYSAIWDANTDPHTVGYRVFGGVASGAYTWSVDVGNATTAALPPLSPGSSYYFVVRAYNAAGELGPASNEPGRPAQHAPRSFGQHFRFTPDALLVASR